MAFWEGGEEASSGDIQSPEGYLKIPIPVGTCWDCRTGLISGIILGAGEAVKREKYLYFYRIQI